MSENIRAEAEALYTQYAGLVRRRAVGLLGSSSNAVEDVVQDVFVRVLTHLATFRREASPVTWLYRITTNLCLDHLRGRGSREKKESHELLEQLASRVSTAEGTVLARDFLTELLGPASSQDLEIFVYRYVDGLSQEEIADVMGLSRKTVWTKLDQLRQRGERLRDAG